MKISNRLLLSALVVTVPLWRGTIACAQLFELTGHVTSATGIYDGVFSSSDVVVLSLKFAPPLEDFHHGAGPVGHYLSPMDLSVGGKSVILGLDPTMIGIDVYNGFQNREGAVMSIGWNGAKNPGTLLQYFYSADDILSSTTLFPSGIPIASFVRTDGYYENESSDFWGGPGRIDWVITSYTGSIEGFVSPPPPPITPIPEPWIYGVLAGVLLGTLVVHRRCASESRSA